MKDIFVNCEVYSDTCHRYFSGEIVGGDDVALYIQSRELKNAIPGQLFTVSFYFGDHRYLIAAELTEETCIDGHLVFVFHAKDVQITENFRREMRKHTSSKALCWNTNGFHQVFILDLSSHGMKIEGAEYFNSPDIEMFYIENGVHKRNAYKIEWTKKVTPVLFQYGLQVL